MRQAIERVGAFHFVAKHNFWSRVLAVDFQRTTVEINVTPPGGAHGDWHRDVSQLVVRRHRQPAAENDLYLDRLPPEIWEWIGAYIDADLRHFIATARDVLDLIDWKRFEQNSWSWQPTFGVSLLCCLRPQAATRVNALIADL